MDLAMLTGITSLVISLLTLAAVVWGFGYRWGRLVGRVVAVEDKVDTMHRIFVENALTYQNQLGMIAHSSPYRFTSKGKEYPFLLSSDQMQRLKHKNLGSAELFLDVIRTIGMDTVVNYCLQNKITVSQAVANTIVAVHSCDDG